MSVYCATADVSAFLPSGGLPNPSRAAEANASEDVIICDGHGLVVGTAVTFHAEIAGALPTGLTDGTTYYVQAVVSSSRFRVAATAGGAAINLTTSGSNFTVFTELPWASWIEWGARQIDSFLPAHVVPIIEPFPEIVITANAELAALRGLQATGGSDIDLGARLDSIQQRLTRWAKTMPIRGAARSNTSPVNLSITASAGAIDPRGWASHGNEVIP